ncbi:plasmid replication protein RepC [Roseomonas sp. E05]|uniref:plasmid replication protein RepC n=1 Tax=Roseomonas sp. E05 TaxID=3046310 RepID=UPI0024B956FF|nr:plasmid replication protein RepC [Roseomonas sp. E05]MDJ0390668.1 plasmid replication protein RepC [Roseomonas sp. E05]
MRTELPEALVPRPTGRRRTTAAQLQATARLRGALPALDKGRVLSAFKQAACAMGFSPAVVHMVDVLFGYSWSTDWQEGWPRLVWPSQEALVSETGLTLSGIKKRLRRLIDLGLIRAHDIGTGRRWGRRDKKTGRILQACGFDLSPIGERMLEFLAAAAEHEARRQEARALRATCSATARAALSLTDHAMDEGLIGADWQGLADAVRHLAATARVQRDLLQLVPLAGRLRLLHDQVEQRVQTARSAVDCVNSNPQGSPEGPPITTTNELQIAKATAPAGRSLAQEAGGVGGEVGTERPNRWQRDGAAEADLFRGFPVSPQVLLHLVPAYRDWVNTSTPSWGQIAEACDLLRQHMGVSTHLYGQAKLVLGGIGASVAIGTIAAKHEARLVKNPGGYLRRMLEKHHTGELRLDKTLHGLADAAGRPGKGRRKAGVPSGAFGRLLT